MPRTRNSKSPKREEMVNKEKRVRSASIGDLIDVSNGIELKRPRFYGLVFTWLGTQPDEELPPDVTRMIVVVTMGFSFGLGITEQGKIKIRVFIECKNEELLLDLSELKKIMDIRVIKNCRPNMKIMEEIKARLGR
jgi:hypothetical protein